MQALAVSSCLALALLATAGSSASAQRGVNEPETLQVAAEDKRPRLVFRSTPEQRRFTGEKISLSLKNADLAEVLRSFAKLAKINLVLDPRVSGRVTVELHDVPWDQALSVILKSQGLGAELDGRVLSVTRSR